MKVIIPVGLVPVGAVITKITGTMEYLVEDNIKIYGVSPQEIKSDEATRFIISNAPISSISTIAASTEVVWHTDINTYIKLFHEDID